MTTDFQEIQHSAPELDENHRAEFLDETEEAIAQALATSQIRFFIYQTRSKNLT